MYTDEYNIDIKTLPIIIFSHVLALLTVALGILKLYNIICIDKTRYYTVFTQSE